MPNRPAIPTEVRREVLFEARHRCAVCCWPLPLELAHIIPWCETRDHSLPNLIALCANCHSQADSEGWSASYLRRYKDKPCALERYNSPPMTVSQQALVEVFTRCDPTTLTERERLRLLSMIAAYLDLSISSITVISIDQANSSRIIIRLPRASIDKLVAGFRDRDPLLLMLLDEFELIRVNSLITEPETPAAQTHRVIQRGNPGGGSRKRFTQFANRLTGGPVATYRSFVFNWHRDNPPAEVSSLGVHPASYPVHGTHRPGKLRDLLSDTEVMYDNWDEHVRNRRLYYVDGIVAFMQMFPERRITFLRSEGHIAKAIESVKSQTTWTEQANFRWSDDVASNQLRHIRARDPVAFTKRSIP